MVLVAADLHGFYATWAQETDKVIQLFPQVCIFSVGFEKAYVCTEAPITRLYTRSVSVHNTSGRLAWIAKEQALIAAVISPRKAVWVHPGTMPLANGKKV